jgi:hypothetical protein
VSKFEFLVGGREGESRQTVIVYAETYGEAEPKALRLAGYRDNAGKAWLQRVEEVR